MDFKELGTEIIDAVGGKENINDLVHCMTRLRFSLVDESLADDARVKRTKGVLGLSKQAGQYQVIIGNHVDKVFKEIEPMLGLSKSKSHSKKGKKNILNTFLDTISGILTPMIPALAAAGMTKVILLVCTLLGLFDKTNSTYLVLDFISDAVFYFMPIMVAYSAANKFKCNPVLAIVFAGVLLHPKFIEMVASGEAITFVGLPVSAVKYSSSIIPSILMVWFMSYVERFADKVSPKVIKVFFKPLLMMLIVAPITLIVIGPIGNYLGELVAKAAEYSYGTFGWITIAILGAILPFIVITGLNRAISPVSIQIFTKFGYEPLFRTAYIGSNLAQGGACLAVAMRTKNKELKQIAYSAGATALLSGITEPALFGVTMKLKRPLIACSIAGGLAGAYAGLMAVKAYAYATPGLLSLAMFIGPNGANIVHAIIAAIIAIVGSFVFTLLLGFEDEVDESTVVENETATRQPLEQKLIDIQTPAQGQVVPLHLVNDQTFSSGICGKGIAVVPETGQIVAPIDGKIAMIFKTKHALSIVGDNGIEMMIHIGIDTVKLDGEFFEVNVALNETVKKGDVLVTFDREAIQHAGYDLTTCLLVQNHENYLEFIDTDKQQVVLGDTIETVLGGAL